MAMCVCLPSGSIIANEYTKIWRNSCDTRRYGMIGSPSFYKKQIPHRKVKKPLRAIRPLHLLRRFHIPSKGRVACSLSQEMCAWWQGTEYRNSKPWKMFGGDTRYRKINILLNLFSGWARCTGSLFVITKCRLRPFENRTPTLNWGAI